MLDRTQAGFYRNMKTGKIVHLTYVYHVSDGRIVAKFTGTRDGKPFGSTHGTNVEDFFQRHAKEA